MRLPDHQLMSRVCGGLFVLFYAVAASALTIPSDRNPKYNSSINPKRVNEFRSVLVQEFRVLMSAEKRQANPSVNTDAAR